MAISLALSDMFFTSMRFIRRGKKLTQKEAAKACNMAETTFYDKAKKFGKE